jgi:MerR family transcriptional regulator, light-induced transcriptional regulator
VAVYSINDLEKLTGIKAHTIRIWEQRYNLVCPQRTKTNIRYYDDGDLKLLLNIALLNKNGIKISKIANMSREDIADKVSAISAINFEYDTQLDALTIAMIEMDEAKFDRIISTNIEQIGFERTMLETIYPFLERLSLLWLTGSVNPVQEHFMSYLLRQKVIVAIDKEPIVTGRDGRKFIIYLPEGERQELSLLFMHYVVKSRRHQVIYLGQDISLDDIRDACAIHHPDYIFTLINEPLYKMTVQQYVDKLANTLPQTTVLLSGYQVLAKEMTLPNNCTLLNSLDDTIEFVDQLRFAPFRRSVVVN